MMRENENDLSERVAALEVAVRGDENDGVAMPGILGVLHEIAEQIGALEAFRNRVRGALIVISAIISILGALAWNQLVS
jgi:hypothetical protein